jgi:hypothetical protein
VRRRPCASRQGHSALATRQKSTCRRAAKLAGVALGAKSLLVMTPMMASHRLKSNISDRFNMFTWVTCLLTMRETVPAGR